MIPAGGFDPTISIYDAQGNYLLGNRDGGCGNVAADTTTGFCWDSYLSTTLPAGTYQVVITQSENLPNGPTLTSGFVYTGQSTFTTPPTPAGVSSKGFWDLYPSKRTSSYAVDILGGQSTVTAITSSNTLPSGIISSGYSGFTFTAAAAAGATLSWSITGGSLPTGMTLNPVTGVLSGTPQSSGTFPLTVQVTDGALPVVSQNVTLTVLGTIQITTSQLPTGTPGQTYTATVNATGGSGSYSFSETGALPSGVTFSAGGVFSGAPTQGGSFPIVVTATDQGTGLSATVNLTLSVSVAALTITSTSSLGAFTPTSTITGSFSATGGILPYTWSAPNLPIALALNSGTGAFSGTGGNPGVYSFTIQVADAEKPAVTASQSVSYSVLGITTSALPNGSTKAAYSATLAAIGGTAPYSFSMSGLPTGFGLSLSTGGVFSGTPATVGSFNFTVTVTDKNGLSSSSSFTLSVTGPTPLTLHVSTSVSLPDGTVSSPYSAPQGLQATGGTPPYTWSLFSGILPSGMSLSGAGNLLGTPSVTGSFPFTAQVTDSIGNSAVGTLTLVIDPAPVTISLGTFPTGVVGVPYPLQILTPLAKGGTPPYTFAVTSGSLPPGLALSGQQISGQPTAVPATNPATFTITVTDAAGKAIPAAGSISILPPQTSLILSQSNLSFSLTAGALGVPTPAVVGVQSSAIVTQLAYSFTVTPAVSWLDVSGAGSTPGSLSVALDPTAPSLAANATPYSAVIGVSCVPASACGGVTQNVSVSLTVTAPPPQLTLSSSILSFDLSSANPVAASQSLGLQNTGGGVINITSITSGSSWLTISGAPTTLAAGPGTSISATADPTGLSAGYYRTTINVTTSVGNATVPVTLLVEPGVIISLQPSGTQYTASAGNSPGIAGGSFAVSMTGNGSVNWTASLNAGVNWLTLNNTSGSSTAASAGSVNYSLNSTVIAGLVSGTYYATITVNGPAAEDATQQFQVVLNITPAATTSVPVLSTAGLLFVSSATVTASPQTVVVYSGSSDLYQAFATTSNGGNWLSVSPATGSATNSSPAQTQVSVSLTGLAPGIYSGGVSYAFNGDGVRTVNVTLLIVGAGGVAAARGAIDVPQAACTPSHLIPTQTGLYGNFAQPAGWPTPVTVNLINDCGNAVNGATLTTTFSNGDPPMALSPLDSVSGIYQGTWTPRNPAPQVTVTATAKNAPLPNASTSVTGEVRTNAVPLMAPNGTFDIYNAQIGLGLSPGEAIQIYGTNLASATLLASSLPLPTSLGGTTVLIGGVPAPLYFVSAGQINAQVPYQLQAGTQYQILVQVSGAISTPQPFQVVPAAPGVADITGIIIAQHAATVALVSEASPAQPGEYLVLYLSGMGSVDNAVASGAAAGANPLSHPVVAPTLTLNGATVPIAFVGLTPGAAGLYQINFQVPPNAPSGDVTLVVSQNGAVSNSVILPIQ